MKKQINKILDIVEYEILNNSNLIVFCFLSFLKPLSLYYVKTINNIYNIWTALVGRFDMFVIH